MTEICFNSVYLGFQHAPRCTQAYAECCNNFGELEKQREHGTQRDFCMQSDTNTSITPCMLRQGSFIFSKRKVAGQYIALHVS